jgi:hypothetical protein
MAFYGERITDKFAYWPGSYGMEYWTRRYPLCDVNQWARQRIGHIQRAGLWDRACAIRDRSADPS